MTSNNPVIVGDTSIELPQPSSPELEVYSYFPTSVYITKKAEFVDFVDVIASEYIDIRKNEPNSFDSIYPMYQTANMFDDPRLVEFASYIGGTTWNILNSQGINMDKKTVFFQEMWCQEHFKYSSMDEHVHGNGAQIVGFFFLTVPENSSKIVIHDPRPGKKQLAIEERDITSVSYASSAINFTPEVGSVFFANAWVPHSFSRNGSDDPIRLIHFTLGIRQAPDVPIPDSPNTNSPVIV